MTYDHWKTTEPMAPFTDPKPMTEEEQRAEALEYWQKRALRLEADLHDLRKSINAICAALAKIGAS
jgi:hypothetical protein